MKSKLTLLTLASAAAIFLSACSSTGMKTTMTPMPFSGPDSVDYSKQLWHSLTSAGLVGANAIEDKPYKGVHPHGAVLETLTSSTSVNGHNGLVIVKRNYGGEGVSIGNVSANRSKYIKAVTVMFKREKGYDSDNQDWFWAKYKPDGSLDKNPAGMQLAGRIAKGKPKGCIACHKAAPGGDYRFLN